MRPLTPKIILSTFLILALASTLTHADERKITARVVNMTGNGEVKISGSGAWTPVRIGTVLKEGDAFKAKSDSRVVIEVSAEKPLATIELEENTWLAFLELSVDEVTRARRIFLDMARGKATVTSLMPQDKKARFEIKTPTSIVDIKEGAISIAVESPE